MEGLCDGIPRVLQHVVGKRGYTIKHSVCPLIKQHERGSDLCSAKKGWSVLIHQNRTRMVLVSVGCAHSSYGRA